VWRDPVARACDKTFQRGIMVTRLSVIATRTGDAGTTGLGDGSRVEKDAPRVAALGDVDELNSVLGVVLASADLPAEVAADLLHVQHDLFDMGAELCIPGHTALNDKHVLHLDERLAHYNADLGALREFILPGGSMQSAQLHVARTVCRRAERSVVELGRTETINAPVRQYLNRLSDMLFVLARFTNKAVGVPDVLWSRAR
jgi:cob(I)alamin adenosyltransferase